MSNLLDIPKAQLPELVTAAGLKPFAAQQLYQWLYRRGATDFAQMSNLSATARASLAERFTIQHPRVAQHQVASDGTIKYLLRLPDGQAVETVMIPALRQDYRPRRTLCLSTQVGCAMACRFCHTGTMGLSRHCSAGEILGQVIVAAALQPADAPITNIVFMGMGEPLHNYDALVAALRIMTDDEGLGFGKRRVTVSTVGLVPAIRRLAEEGIGVKLALSLHATTDAVRQQLIPLAKRYSLAETLAACGDYCRAQGARTRVTLEYLLLREVNDTPADAERLGALTAHLPAKINLIPWNEYPGAPWRRPEDERIEHFAECLRRKQLQVNIRHSRGRDILAACGQLATQAGTHHNGKDGTS